MNPRPRVLEPPDEHLHEFDLDGNRCPTCEQPIAWEQAEEIKSRIEDKERRDEEEVQKRLAQERVAGDAKTAEKVAAVEAAAAAQLATVEEGKAAEVAAARDEATKAANEAMQPKLLEADEKRKVAEDQFAALKAAHDLELAAAREDATKAANEAMAPKLVDAEEKRKAAEESFTSLKDNHETELTRRLAEQREVLEEDKVKAINLANAESFKENQKLVEKVAAMQRQLQRKTAEELGEGAEIELFEALKDEFPKDDIKRVKKGEPGADIVHRVIEKGKVCGTIVYDSKNRNAWRNDFVEKLRSDQRAAKADHAILTTHAFPSGAHQIHVQDGVIIANPARAVVLATMLRKHIVQVHAMRVSNDARDEKRIELYEWIRSEQVAQWFEQLESVNQELLDLDVKEKKDHDKTWNRRGSLIKSSQRATGELTCGIDRIIGHTDSASAATG
ncbi:MAG: DUF2130 domain-containing protein [Acidimicrobiales bacterium]